MLLLKCPLHHISCFVCKCVWWDHFQKWHHHALLMYMYVPEEVCPFLSCRTNPKANVTLSGKKKRLLVKEARRTLAEKVKMEGMSDAWHTDLTLSLAKPSLALRDYFTPDMFLWTWPILFFRTNWIVSLVLKLYFSPPMGTKLVSFPGPMKEPGNEAIPHLVLDLMWVLITSTQLTRQRQLTVEKTVAKEVLTRWTPHKSSVITA